MKTPEEVFPEYFLIRVNEFNDVATTPIEEWLDYLKNGRIKENTTTPGLAEAMKETARNLKSIGMPSEDIAKVTGLTLEEIKELS